jgi:hypothetical protein
MTARQGCGAVAVVALSTSARRGDAQAIGDWGIRSVPAALRDTSWRARWCGVVALVLDRSSAVGQQPAVLNDVGCSVEI